MDRNNEVNRFVFVIDAFTKGGAQRNLELVLPELVSQGYEVDLILIQNSNSEFSLDNMAASGVRIHRVGASRMFDLLGFFRFARSVGRTPTLLVANLFWSQIWSSFLGFSFPHLKVVWVEHNTYLNRSKIQWTIYRLCSRRIHTLLTVSREIKEFVEPMTETPIQTINNASRAYFDREQSDLTEPKFLLVGRLVKQKNPELALDGFKLALQSGFIPSTSKLLVIGTGPLERNLIEKVSKWGLSSEIQFLGFLNSSEISKIMAKAHVLIMSSIHEGSPLVRLEALVHGMTIVTTKTAGILDILTVENSDSLIPGVFVSESDSQNIAEDLSIAISPKVWTHVAVNARLSASEKFSPKKVAASYIKLIAN